MDKITIEIENKQNSYNIYMGYDVFDEIAGSIAEGKYGSKLAIITDANVKKIYGNMLRKKLMSKNLDVALFDFQAGEKSKTRETKAILEDKLIDNEFGRDSAIIALGGGVVGDLAGFVAATYMRGIPYIQIPTTTIAQSDSSIGGKTAVDAPKAKNTIGAFWHPKDIFMDLKMLETLDKRNYNSGLIEAVKHGIIYDESFFELIEENTGLLLSRAGDAYAKAISDLLKRNCTIKNRIVQQDEKENDLRKILNYGHTVGHAVEALSNFSLLHGEAVAIGIAAEAFFSYKLGYCSKEAYERQLNIVERLGLPTEIPDDILPGNITELMRIDKKVRDNEPEFVMLEKIGKTKSFDGRHTTKIDADKLQALLKEFCKGR